MTITEFINARIDEDQTAATLVSQVDERTGALVDSGYAVGWTADGHFDPDSQWFGATWNGPRVLAQCEAMRRIVKRNGDVMGEQPPTSVLDEDGWVLLAWEAMYDLAAIWSDHADYDPAWRA